MKLGSLIVLVLAIIGGTKGVEVQRAERPMQAAQVEVFVPKLATAVATDGVTDFECLDLGPFDTQCWTRGGVETCVEAPGSSLEIIEPGHWSMGDRALAWIAKCLSDEPPIIRLRFGTPVQAMQFTLGVSTEPRALVCWVGVDADVLPKFPAPVVLEPRVDYPVDLPWSIGLHVGCNGDGCGVVVCDVYGHSVDNILATTP